MKRINTILAIAMTLVLSLGLTGCGKSSPKDVAKEAVEAQPVSYTHLTLPTTCTRCRSRWSPYH